ncbi:MAG: hypothetical protein ACYDCH_00900 [Gaiellaceae bacterium]
MRFVVVALGTLLLAGGPPPSWHTFRAHGVTVRYPPSWFATARPLTPVSWPSQIIALASYPLPTSDAGADGCEPKAALTRMPAGGAFVYGLDYGPLSTAGVRPSDFPPEPKHFTLTGFARYECMGPSYMVRFRSGGRAFQIHISLGRKAGRATRATVLRILDSFSAPAS